MCSRPWQWKVLPDAPGAIVQALVSKPQLILMNTVVVYGPLTPYSSDDLGSLVAFVKGGGRLVVLDDGARYGAVIKAMIGVQFCFLPRLSASSRMTLLVSTATTSSPPMKAVSQSVGQPVMNEGSGLALTRKALNMPTSTPSVSAMPTVTKGETPKKPVLARHSH